MAEAQNDLRSKIMAIMTDTSLTDVEKAQKRQELMSGMWSKPASAEGASAKDKGPAAPSMSGTPSWRGMPACSSQRI